MTPDELRAALIGTWRLVSYEATSVDDGEVVRPYGEHPLGLIMYTADGYMSAQITTPDRPLFGSSGRSTGPGWHGWTERRCNWHRRHR